MGTAPTRLVRTDQLIKRRMNRMKGDIDQTEQTQILEVTFIKAPRININMIRHKKMHVHYVNVCIHVHTQHTN